MTNSDKFVMDFWFEIEQIHDVVEVESQNKSIGRITKFGI